jgi:ATP-binding cassette subfamily B protein/subfamily B ATP-binding cassette protein MsbA
MVQAFARREFEEDRFQRETAQNLAEGIRVARSSAAVSRVIEVICALSTAITLLSGSWQAFKGYMTPGDLLIFVSYLKSIYKPIRELGRSSVKVSRAAVCAERINEVLAIEAEPPDPPHAITAANLTGDVIFRNVSFGYERGRPLLEEVSFHIHPGQKVALVGPSGTGKSTLIGLILRLYEPQRGCILLDGVDVRDYQRESLRRSIGLVLQDSVLFAATVRENIAYGQPEASSEAIEAAARHAYAHDFIMALPDGYETVVGERGCTLSGGQRQRICLARALIKQPSILILDEPTSAVDPASASMIHVAINRLHADKTVVLISHQISSAGDFDQILTLRDRKVYLSDAREQCVRLRGGTVGSTG